jgi:hypothetical protein
MYLSKIVVLIAHGNELNIDQLADDINVAVGQQLIGEDRHQIVYEVRAEATKEVTLASMDYSLEERATLEEATK